MADIEEKESLHSGCDCHNTQHQDGHAFDGRDVLVSNGVLRNDGTDSLQLQDDHNKLADPPHIVRHGSDLEKYTASLSAHSQEKLDDNFYFTADLDVDDESMEEMKRRAMDSPSRLLLLGRQVIPHYPPGVQDICDISLAGSSCISLPLRPVYVSAQQQQQQQDLVWLGSSLGTMHKVPKKLKPPFCRSHKGDIYIKRSPSGISKKGSSCNFSSLTVSSCGTDMRSLCRICQMPGEDRDPLISPCRCCGTLRYIHVHCLKKWIRVSQKRGRKQPPRCELCHFTFVRHKQFKFSQWRWPRVRTRDKCLHIIFLLNLLIMIGCAIATIMCFLSDRDNAAKFPRNKAKLTTEEVITLTCGVMFFVAFFIAMTVEIKARHTLYKLFLRFIMHNTEWTVEQYDPNKDPLIKKGNHHASKV